MTVHDRTTEALVAAAQDAERMLRNLVYRGIPPLALLVDATT